MSTKNTVLGLGALFSVNVSNKIMDSKQFRVLIYHCFLMSKNTVETREWLEKCYPDAAPSKSTVERWFSEFNRGRTDTDDAKRSGRPNRVVTPENIEKVKEIVAANRKAKLQDIADTLKISKGSVFTILQEHRAQTTDDGDGVVVDEEEVTAPDARYGRDIIAESRKVLN